MGNVLAQPVSFRFVLGSGGRLASGPFPPAVPRAVARSCNSTPRFPAQL